jgi:hypothetical protein
LNGILAHSTEFSAALLANIRRALLVSGLAGTYSRATESNHHWQYGEELMETDGNPIKEVLDDLFTLLESLETQNIAVLQFLKEQGIAPEDKLAPYLEQASAASSVKWRAARARMNYLLAPAPKKSSEPSEKERKDKEPTRPGAGTDQGKPINAKSPEPKSPEPKTTDAQSSEPNPDAETKNRKTEKAEARDDSGKASALKNIGPTDAEPKSEASEKPKNSEQPPGKATDNSRNTAQEKDAKPATGNAEAPKEPSQSGKSQ